MKITLNILILPLLGGYLFIRRFLWTKYKARRYRGYHIFFNSAVAGFVLFAISYVTVRWIGQSFPGISSAWDGVVPYSHTGKALGAFLLGYFGSYAVNFTTYLRRQISWSVSRRLPECVHKAKLKLSEAVHNFKNPYPYEKRGVTRDVIRVIEERGDSFEMFLAESMIQWKQVMITLESDKVYIGYVVANFNPSNERKYVKILKSASGYREKEKRSLNISTVYGDHMRESIDKFESVTTEDFIVVIPVSSIVGMSRFDNKVFSVFDMADGDGAQENERGSFVEELLDTVGFSKIMED